VTYHVIGNFFRDSFGELAGWAHTVLFAAELSAFSGASPGKRGKGSEKKTRGKAKGGKGKKEGNPKGKEKGKGGKGRVEEKGKGRVKKEEGKGKGRVKKEEKGETQRSSKKRKAMAREGEGEDFFGTQTEGRYPKRDRKSVKHFSVPSKKLTCGAKKRNLG
jgi:N-glycosylase/DNA lyase